MQRIKTILILLLLGSSWSHGQTLPLKKNYSYSGIKGETQQIEAHFPSDHSASDKKPCFIFFHGGGWQSGSLKASRTFNDYLTSRGMVVLSASYSMHRRDDKSDIDLNDPDAINKPMELPEGESRKRVCVIDGKTVVRWAKSQAAELGIDPGRIVVSGASAGGHIGVLQMMDETFNHPDLATDVSTNVAAFILLCPAFTKPEREKTPDVNVFQHAGKPFPPSRFIVGERDNWKAASDALCEELARNDQPIEVWMGPNARHMFHRTRDWRDTVLYKMDQFLTAQGLLEGESPMELAADAPQLKKLRF